MIRSHVSMRDSLVVVLTLTTGAVDVTSFLALGNVFSSVVTGDLVLLGAAAGTGRPELAVHSGVALAGYLAGVMAGAPLAVRWHHASGTWPPSVTVTLAVELVILVARGLTNGQIAAELFISVRTVSSHLDRIRDKTGCRRRADLTRLALTEGLV